MIFNIPAVRYHRPAGYQEPGKVRVECVSQEEYDKLAANLEVMKERNITVTLEMVDQTMVSVCLDDGNFDYKTELWPNGEVLLENVKKLILDFDLDDYLKAANAHFDAEQAGPPPEPRDKPEWDKVSVFNDWLVYDTGEHNCVGGTIEASGMHEPQCGLEPIAKMDEVWDALIAAGLVVLKQAQEETKPDTLPEPSDYFPSRGG